jgi:hypothetical protein
VSASWRDLDGDGDSFPDTGETGRIALRLRAGPERLTAVTLHLSSSDSDVACVPMPHLPVGDLAPFQELEAGSLDPAAPGFTVKASNFLQSPSGADPARLELCLHVQAEEFEGFSAPLCFHLPADLDLPAGPPPPPIPGPDGMPGTAADGLLLEGFDRDRDGDGFLTVQDAFRQEDRGTGTIGHGSYVRATGSPGGAGILSGVACGGFRTPAEGNLACILDPTFPMDWHLHCPPGAADCPNTESGACADGLPNAPCTFATPSDGTKALSPPASMHLGLHFVGLDSRHDTTHLRALQAFVSSPINLALEPAAGGLQLSMAQIVDLMDDNGVSVGRGMCADCADVQVQVDRDADPAIDDWGFWEKLAPFQNVYDHVPTSYSSRTGDYYCAFTPTDTGAAPPAPHGVPEILCFPAGAWSHCGSVRGTSIAQTEDCEGPAALEPSGAGVWVETRFDLSPLRGQRIRIRWIAESWLLDASIPHYAAFDNGWFPPTVDDDGWWLDDVRITGVLAAQFSPAPDLRPSPGGICPESCPDADGDGYAQGGSPLCPGGGVADCDDTNGRIHPGAPERCNRKDDDCDGALPPEERDADGDSRIPCGGDCDDTDPTIPRDQEINNGRDDQCPGMRGYGLIDEIYRVDVSDRFGVCWFPQEGATGYGILRSGRRDFTTDCLLIATNSCQQDAAIPEPGRVFYYLVRAAAPFVGSWGADSTGIERHPACLP